MSHKSPSKKRGTKDPPDATIGDEDTLAGLKPAAATIAPAKKKRKTRTNATFKVEDWNKYLFDALLYKAEHGDLNVKSQDEENAELYAWMQEQRKQFKKHEENPALSTLTEDQIKVLDSLQFGWHTRGEEHWNRNYNLLKEFHKEHGHCLVQRQSSVGKLGDWVTDQRRQYKLMNQGLRSLLTPKRKALLDEIGFVWQVRQRSGWKERYAELLEFKKEFGDTIVPQHYHKNVSLGKWVAKQREQYRLLQMGKHSFLTPDRLQLLNDIGFVWRVQGRGRPPRARAAAENEPADIPVAAALPKSETGNAATTSTTAQAVAAAAAAAVAAVATEKASTADASVAAAIESVSPADASIKEGDMKMSAV